ncbi:hypothetical protein FRC12_012349 [Ceratobasidium sp. 428]|nr:hypothetical protein FRC12_012349 [Ceratobasidium sp. 428]
MVSSEYAHKVTVPAPAVCAVGLIDAAIGKEGSSPSLPMIDRARSHKAFAIIVQVSPNGTV